MFVLPALRSMQKDCKKLKASLGYVERKRWGGGVSKGKGKERKKIKKRKRRGKGKE